MHHFLTLDPVLGPVFLVGWAMIGASAGLLAAIACKAFDDWYATGAERRAMNRRTDRRAARHLQRPWSF